MAATSSSLRVLKDIRTILRIKKEFPSFCLPTLSSAKTPQSSSSEDVSIPNLNPVIEDSAKRNAKNLRHELISVIRMHSGSNKSEEELKTLRSALSSYAELLIRFKSYPHILNITAIFDCYHRMFLQQYLQFKTVEILACVR